MAHENYAFFGWNDAKAGKPIGAMDRNIRGVQHADGKLLAYREGWRAFHTGLPRPGGSGSITGGK